MVQVLERIADMRAWSRAEHRAGRRIGLVPTMGYLHEGHLTLLRQARAECDAVVLSIFVNPTQFGQGEDLATYPRDLPRDLQMAATVPVDVAFCPEAAAMYPAPYHTYVEVEEITRGLCGAARPGHFRGVATVVLKLLQIVDPDRAYFGQKDAQQLAVIQRMVDDLNVDVTIVPVPIVREPDGLAMSSRNVYLSPAERRAALMLSRSLSLAQGRVQAGERDARRLLGEMRYLIEAEPLARIDYVAIVDPVTLQPVDAVDQRALAAVAVHFGRARLIDNAYLEPPA